MRYITEIKKPDLQTFQKVSLDAINVYEEAMLLASGELTPSDPIRLGLALNYSTFLHEVINKPSQACMVCKVAYDDAIAEIDMMEDENTYRCALIILKKMKENLCDWVASLERRFSIQVREDV